MYKLILVDDEDEVRRGILEKIDWSAIGYEVVGEAANGIEALEISEKVVPDVVITDIKMPFMDGILLSQKLRERFPTTKIIILTGFDEFEYAQKAIKLNVVEYALKPISSKELVDILVKVKAKIDEEISQREDIEALKGHYKKSLPLLREKFLGSLITSSLKGYEIIEKSSVYGLDLNGSGFVVSVISTDSDNNNSDSENMAIVSGSAFHSYENKELVKFAVLNICEEIACKHSSYIPFLFNDYIVIIHTFRSVDRDAFMENVITVLEEIRMYTEKYHKLKLTIGVGVICSDIANLSLSYENAITALDYRLILGSNRIICIEDIEPRRTERIVFDVLKERILTSSIKIGTSEEIARTIDYLFQEIIDTKTSFKDYQVYLLEMLTAILKIARDLNVDMDNLFGDNYNLFVEMFKFKDLKDVKVWLTGICMKIRGYISKDRQDTYKLLINKATEYIKNCYSDSDMTIDKVCRFLHISPTYFSTIFKRETKLTFVNYLTHVRMEVAKELLRSTDYKTFEIANMTGYSEPNYFSYCFKKNFNVSPSEYRKAAKQV